MLMPAIAGVERRLLVEGWEEAEVVDRGGVSRVVVGDR